MGTTLSELQQLRSNSFVEVPRMKLFVRDTWLEHTLLQYTFRKSCIDTHYNNYTKQIAMAIIYALVSRQQTVLAEHISNSTSKYLSRAREIHLGMLSRSKVSAV